MWYVPGTVKDVKDYKLALVFYSHMESRTEVEIFRTSESREARKDHLAEAGIKADYAYVNMTM